MKTLPVCFSVCHVHAWCLVMLEEGIRSPGLELKTAVSQQPCGDWELNAGPLQGHHVHLTTSQLSNHLFHFLMLSIITSFGLGPYVLYIFLIPPTVFSV